MKTELFSKRLCLALLALVALIIVGCGSSTDEQISNATKKAPPAAEFPPAAGHTWSDLAGRAPKNPQVVVAPAGQTYEVGENRFSFGVFELDRTQIPDAQVAIYASPGANGPLEGPFPARIESLQTEPAFQSQTVSLDPQAATVAYVSTVKFTKPGEWRITAVIKKGNTLTPNIVSSVRVGAYKNIPNVGDLAPKIHTPTAADVGGDLSKIDTRSPHDTMHDTDFADVVGKKPIVLQFSTPALCTSRVCGPMVDIAEQVKAQTDGDVAFIHMEVYNQNDPNKGIRPQLRAYGLQSEPWLFVIDKSGHISTRIEGAFSVDDLKNAVAKVNQ